MGILIEADKGRDMSLSEAKRLKAEEIRRAALRAGQAGIDINTGDLSYHMAATPEDVALLQQANQVARMTWEAMGLPSGSPYRVAEIKEKWPDGSTKLHSDVPEAVHDAVLFQAVLYAREILLRQEALIQAVQDAATPEEAEGIAWQG